VRKREQMMVEYDEASRLTPSGSQGPTHDVLHVDLLVRCFHVNPNFVDRLARAITDALRYAGEAVPGGTPIVNYINSVAKYVISTTLGEVGWNNSTLIQGNDAEEIAELKWRPGKDITILGSGALVRSLLKDRLLDQLRLMVHPVVLGYGKHLFEDGDDRKPSELIDSRTFGTGVIYLTYRPAGQ
jgi:dihydrofolate reductase